MCANYVCVIVGYVAVMVAVVFYLRRAIGAIPGLCGRTAHASGYGDLG